MSKNIVYSELKKAIIEGSSTYITSLDNRNNLAGFFHGNEGRIRAQKAHIYACVIKDDISAEQSMILALTLAIFTSSSKGLAMCIAELLIKGEKGIIGVCGNDMGITREYGALSSAAFSTEMVNGAASLLENEDIQSSDSPLGPSSLFNKSRGVYWILNHEKRDQNNNSIDFQINFFKEQLAKSSEIDVNVNELNQFRTL